MAKKSKPFDLAHEGTKADQDAFRFYASHLVALAGLCQKLDAHGAPKGEADCFFFSGFVIVLRRRWYFATAGHNLEKIEAATSSSAADIRECRLIDCFGLQAKSTEPIPFDYSGAFKYFRFSEDDGLDFGLIELSSNHRRLLQANGVAAISKKHWKDQNWLDFDEHFMLGLPEDSIDRRITRGRIGYVVHGKPNPNVIYVKRVKRPEKAWMKRYPRFVGRLPARHRLTVGDIAGMSGGPIFGFAEKNSEDYRIVAIQSTWLKNEGVNFGCPVPIFAELAERHLKSIGR